MRGDDIAIGMRVRYPRTGTTGTVLRIAHEEGHDFAELDTTRLLYRIDQLEPAATAGRGVARQEFDQLSQIEKEREYARGAGYQDALLHTDQSCEGGG